MRAFLDRLRPWAPLALRMMLAVVFVYYGWKKVHGGMEGFTKTVTGWGFPLWLAKTAAWTELVGGVLVGVGLLTRLAALGLVGVMFVAVWKVHLHQGFGQLQFPLMCGAAALSLVLSGAGRLSIDSKLTRGA